MFISACLECYDGKDGDVTNINRVDEDDPVCICGRPNYYIYTNRKSGSGNSDYELISESLAINPVQTRAHRKLFPSVDVLPDGRLRFKSFRSHDTYLEQTGFVKIPQKIRGKKKKKKKITPIATGKA